MYADLVETLLLEVTTEADENEAEENNSDEEKRKCNNEEESLASDINSAAQVYERWPPLTADENPSWEVRMPKHTYQRKAIPVCSRKENHRPKAALPPNMNSSSCTEVDLGPILKESSPEKHCLVYQFPSCPSYTFEESQALMMLQLNSPHLIEDRNEDALPSKHKISARTQEEPCKYYNRTFRNPQAFSRRKPPESRKRSKQCEFCGKLYTSPRGSHLQSCTSVQEKISCPDCGKILASVKSFRRHRQIHLRQSDEKPYPCDVCQKRFASKRSVSRHMIIHAGKKPHACRICGRAFRQKDQLGYHMTIHTGIKKLTCPGCGKQFMYPSIMKLHKCRS